MNKILIIDDEEELREVYELIIGAEFDNEIVLAKSGNEAIAILESDTANEIGIILSDYSMADGDGGVVYNYNKKNLGKPFCFISGGYLDQYKNLDDFDLESANDHYLQKPIKAEELISKVKELFGLKNVGESPCEENGYKRVRSSFLLNNCDHHFDIYIQINENKFVKFINGSEIEEKDLKKLKEKGENYLFLNENDFKKFVAKSLARLSEKIDTANDPLKVVRTSQEIISFINDHFSEFGISEKQIELVNKSVAKCNAFISTKCSGLASLIEKLDQSEGYLPCHSLLAMQIAYQITDKMNQQSSLTLEKLSYASILHDLSFSNPEFSKIIDSDIDDFETLPKQARDEIFEHPRLVAKLVESEKALPPDIYHIIIEHHERADAEGFPQKLAASRINILSCVFILSLRVAHHLYFYKMENLDDLRESLQSWDKGNFKKPLKALLSFL